MAIEDFRPSLFERMSSLLPDRLANSMRWRLFRLARPNGRLDIKAIGHRWRLHLNDNRTERLIWLYRKHPEKLSLAWLMSACHQKRTLIIDIGANCGAFTIPLIAAAGSGSLGFAFEPNPIMNERLQENLKLNILSEKVTVHACALGAAPGEANLKFRANMGEATLRSVDCADGESIRVPVRPLSEFMATANRFEVTLLKIDVEGYEPEVLVPFFATAAPDVWPTHILIETDHMDTWSLDLLSTLERAGYVVQGNADGNTFLTKDRTLS